MYLQLAVSSMFEPFFVLEGVGLLDSRDAIRRHGAEGSLNTERVWVVLAGSSSILSKRQNVPISHIVERAVPISHKRKDSCTSKPQSPIHIGVSVCIWDAAVGSVSREHIPYIGAN